MLVGKVSNTRNISQTVPVTLMSIGKTRRKWKEKHASEIPEKEIFFYGTIKMGPLKLAH
jgi:hypothetical protein